MPTIVFPRLRRVIRRPRRVRRARHPGGLGATAHAQEPEGPVMRARRSSSRRPYQRPRLRGDRACRRARARTHCRAHARAGSCAPRSLPRLSLTPALAPRRRRPARPLEPAPSASRPCRSAAHEAGRNRSASASSPASACLARSRSKASSTSTTSSRSASNTAPPSTTIPVRRERPNLWAVAADVRIFPLRNALLHRPARRASAPRRVGEHERHRRGHAVRVDHRRHDVPQPAHRLPLDAGTRWRSASTAASRFPCLRRPPRPCRRCPRASRCRRARRSSGIVGSGSPSVSPASSGQ